MTCLHFSQGVMKAVYLAAGGRCKPHYYQMTEIIQSIPCCVTAGCHTALSAATKARRHGNKKKKKKKHPEALTPTSQRDLEIPLGPATSSNE